MQNRRFIKVIVIFLAVVIFLTLFSKTIYNFNLPTVTTATPTGGILVDKFEKTAMITYSDITKVYAEDSFRIKSILVAEGDSVVEGQTLLEYHIDEDKVDDLTLQVQKKQSDIELLRLKLGTIGSSDSETQMTKVEGQITNANTKITRLEAEISELEGTAADEGSPQAAEYRNAITNAETDLSNAQVLYAEGIISKSELNKAETALETANNQFAQYLQDKNTTNNDKIESKREQIQTLKDSLLDLQVEMETLTRQQTSSDATAAYDAEDLSSQIINAEAELKLLEKQLASAKSGIVTAEQGGTVTEINAAKNQIVNANDTLMQLVGDADELQMEVAIDEKEQELLTPDSKIAIKVNGVSGEFTGNILASKTEQTDGEAKQMLTVAITDGSSELAKRNATLTFSTESQIYSVIVPNDAVNKDEKGYYVLVLREDDSIFGSGYLASRVDVNLLDSDATLSAISGLTIIEPVIQTATGSVRNGSRVKYEAQ